jgi:hypothetical protein
MSARSKRCHMVARDISSGTKHEPTMAARPTLHDPEPEPEPGQDERHYCTEQSCDLEFASLEELKRHKATDVNHHYCKKCDLDFADDLRHIMHRISTPQKHSMAPLVGRRVSKLTCYLVTCPVCGLDVS